MMHDVIWTHRYVMFVLLLLILAMGCAGSVSLGDGQEGRDDNDGHVNARRLLSLSDLHTLYGAAGQGICVLISRSIRLGLLLEYVYTETGAFPVTIEELNAFLHAEHLSCDISEVLAIRFVTLSGTEISFAVDTVYGEISGRVERYELSRDAFIEAWDQCTDMESACSSGY